MNYEMSYLYVSESITRFYGNSFWNNGNRINMEIVPKLTSLTESENTKICNYLSVN